MKSSKYDALNCVITANAFTLFTLSIFYKFLTNSDRYPAKHFKVKATENAKTRSVENYFAICTENGGFLINISELPIKVNNTEDKYIQRKAQTPNTLLLHGLNQFFT